MTLRLPLPAIAPLLFAVASVCAEVSMAQDAPVAEATIPPSGLALDNVSQRGDSFGSYDPIEVRMVRDGLDAYDPQEGEAVTLPDGQTRRWKSVELDENGEIERQVFGRGGYLYVPVRADTNRVMMLSAGGHASLYFNGEPHTGNVYGYDYYHIPVLVRQGKNSLLLKSSRGKLKVKLYSPPGPQFLLEGDTTLPDLVVGEPTDSWGAVIVVNATELPMRDLTIVARGEGLDRVTTKLPTIPALSNRKVGFRIQGPPARGEGTASGTLELVHADGSPIHQIPLALPVRLPHAARKVTFVSEIDGSVQYFALRSAKPLSDEAPPPALVLSLHGAAVEALGQAAAYSAKSWLHLVAPTNRRPYGFDWEDFGRADAMEVLRIAKQTLRHDPARVYLTGHSMGGHGAWHIGSLFPDTFAAIGPSAGWISFASYARRQRGDAPEPSAMDRLLRRGQVIGNPIELAPNLKHHGVYVLHGADDRNVPASQARRMAEVLQEIHRDWSLHEEPGKGHWWSNDLDDGGATCMDWPPMYDLFARHAIPPTPSVRSVEFVTANPGVSSHCYWLAIEGQLRHQAVSKATVHAWPNKRRFEGTTDNVAVLRLDVPQLMAPGALSIQLDGQSLQDVAYPDGLRPLWLRRENDRWRVTEEPSREHKGPHRYGAVKNELAHRFLFVFGTAGTDQENRWMMAKARFDAETFWYRGNGSVDIAADADFQPELYGDRTVVLYGNAETNSAWSKLLADSPVQVHRGRLRVGDRELQGAELATTFVQPRRDSDAASVIAIAATGLAGMRLACNQSLFVPFVRYPDCLVLAADHLETGRATVRAAGYFGLDWSVKQGEFVWNEDSQ